MLKAIHAQEDRAAAREKAARVVEKLEAMKLSKAAEIVRQGADETLSYIRFPSEHQRSLRTNNPLERIMKEIRRRTRVVGAGRHTDPGTLTSMLSFSGSLKVFVAVEPCDMRRSFDGLHNAVSHPARRGPEERRALRLHQQAPLTAQNPLLGWKWNLDFGKTA
jgi:hypothetical protein